MRTFADWSDEGSAAVGQSLEPVTIRLQPQAGEALALAAGWPVFPPPMPLQTVRVRNSVRCPACGHGRVSRDWRLEARAVIAGTSCWHVFVMPPPLPYL